MKKETKKAPTIRFRGFTDDWEQRKLGEIFTERSEKKHEYLPPLTIIQGCGTVRRDEMDRELIYDKSSLSNYKLVKKNDFIVHLRSFEGGLEKSNIEGIVSPAYHIFHGEKINTEFYYSFFRSNDFINHKLVPFVYGIRDGRSIDIAGMKTIKIPYPSVNEQNRIGTLIGQLNSLIALHQRKLAQLKKLKKYFLQNMFPAKGEKVPRIRFKGFTGDWEQRKLGDFGAVAMCKRIFKDQTSEKGDIPFYKIGTFGGVPDAYIPRELFNEYKQMYPYPEKGDILISASGSIGRTVEYTGEDAYFQDSNIVWLRHDKSIVNLFLKYLYEVIQWAGIEGSTIKRLYNDNILTTEVMIPSVQEQEKIGAYLDSIDHLITLHQRKLDQLQTMKKFMLQNLFI